MMQQQNKYHPSLLHSPVANRIIKLPLTVQNAAFFPQARLDWQNGQQGAKRLGVPERNVAKAHSEDFRDNSINNLIEDRRDRLK